MVALAPLLAGVIERIADKKIPDDTVPKLCDGLLGIAQSFADRAIVVLEQRADRVTNDVQAVIKANPLVNILEKVFRR
ncbi:hypothetical protein B5566_02350 [Mycobacterium sp. MHSD3]|nr:hypothetical protein B5566_02350 [Mycobacterium sp. MHSD3]